MVTSMSSFLDLLRFGAALAVFLGHCNFPWFFGSAQFGPQNGQDYVIVFFVLSGFVIAWSMSRKGDDLSFAQFAFDRLTRLWSVALPALLIGFSLEWASQPFQTSTTYDTFSLQNLLRYFVTASFLHETWFLSVRPGSNAPFWSLSYEFFYYFMFGSLHLLNKMRYKIFACLACALLAGPKVLLLLPCWLVGVLAYHSARRFPPNRFLSILLLVGSVGFLLFRLLERWEVWHPWSHPGLGVPPLFYSAKYMDDYQTALACALMVFAASTWLSWTRTNAGTVCNLIRHLANSTFSLYLFHFPILIFLSTTWSSYADHPLAKPFAIITALLLCYLLSFPFERPLAKHRKQLLSLFPVLTQKCGIK